MKRKTKLFDLPTEQRRNILFSNKHDELSTGIIVIGHLGTAQLFATTSLGHAGSFHRAHSSHTYSCDVIIDFRVRAQFRRCAFCSVFFFAVLAILISCALLKISGVAKQLLVAN